VSKQALPAHDWRAAEAAGTRHHNRGREMGERWSDPGEIISIQSFLKSLPVSLFYMNLGTGRTG